MNGILFCLQNICKWCFIQNFSKKFFQFSRIQDLILYSLVILEVPYNRSTNYFAANRFVQMMKILLNQHAVVLGCALYQIHKLILVDNPYLLLNTTFKIFELNSFLLSNFHTEALACLNC